MMEDFKPNEHAFIGEIKKQIFSFISNSKILDDNMKKDFIKELGRNWIDERFDGDIFMPNAVRLAMHDWQNINFELVDLWKKIVVENAKINNSPHEVADEVIKKFKQNFNLES